MDKPFDEQLFSILIPTCNDLDALILTINSLKKNSAYEHQIIVHVYGNNHSTLAWLQDNGIEYTYTKLYVGLCYSMNVCASLAHCEYILLSEGANYFCPGWDMHLFNIAQKQKDDFWCISATDISHTSKKENWAIDRYQYGNATGSFNEEMLLAAVDQLQIDNWIGTNMQALLLKRNIWNAVGGLSIEFTPGICAELDLTMKLWSMGMRNFLGIANSRILNLQQWLPDKVKENYGHKTFLQKWRISVDTFKTYYVSANGSITENTKIPKRIRIRDYVARVWNTITQIRRQ